MSGDGTRGVYLQSKRVTGEVLTCCALRCLVVPCAASCCLVLPRAALCCLAALLPAWFCCPTLVSGLCHLSTKQCFRCLRMAVNMKPPGFLERCDYSFIDCWFLGLKTVLGL